MDFSVFWYIEKAMNFYLYFALAQDCLSWPCVRLCAASSANEQILGKNKNSLNSTVCVGDTCREGMPRKGDGGSSKRLGCMERIVKGYAMDDRAT